MKTDCLIFGQHVRAPRDVPDVLGEYAPLVRDGVHILCEEGEGTFPVYVRQCLISRTVSLTTGELPSTLVRPLRPPPTTRRWSRCCTSPRRPPGGSSRRSQRRCLGAVSRGKHPATTHVAHPKRVQFEEIPTTRTSNVVF